MKRIRATWAEFNARDFESEAFEEILFTGTAFAAGGAATLVGAQVAKRLVAKSARAAAFKVGGVAAKSLIGPLGWVLLGGEIIYGGYSIRKKNEDKGDEAASETRRLNNEKYRLRVHIAEMKALCEKLSALCDGIDGFLRRCNAMRGTDYSSLDDADHKLLWTLANAAMALLIVMRRDDGKGVAA